MDKEYGKSGDIYNDLCKNRNLIGENIRFSYTHYLGKDLGKENEIVINIDLENYKGNNGSGMSKEDYEEYVITHEFMHALGYDHQVCNEENSCNGTCPVMYQSTRGCPKGFECGKLPIEQDFSSPIDGYAKHWNIEM